MELTGKQLQIMDAVGHVLVTGGPGSGKTTISILKAAQIVERDLRPGQKALFLSFARATVSRVVEAIEYEQRIPREQKTRIDVETYHSFFWRILKAHGYLVGVPRRVSILTPPAEAIALSTVRNEYAANSKLTDADKAARKAREDAERLRLARGEGRVCFDLFAPFVGDILLGSQRIRRLIAAMYPVVILDEFQDTNAEQWRVVEAMGENITLLALADPEQRIYDFIGADPARLDHFRAAFCPTEIDLGADNHRSTGTDIVAFGNDLLIGKFHQRRYNGVDICPYEPNAAQAMTSLVAATYGARKRLLNATCKDWSLAILVPTKKMTWLVSDAFRSPPAGMTEIVHTAAIELEAAVLGAEIVAFLMQPDGDGRHFEEFIALLRNYFHGKGGDAPARCDLDQAESIRKAHDECLARRAAGTDIRKNSILIPLRAVYDDARALRLAGDPDRDWREVRHVLEVGACPRLKDVAGEVRNVRLLDAGRNCGRNYRKTGAITEPMPTRSRSSDGPSYKSTFPPTLNRKPVSF